MTMQHELPALRAENESAAPATGTPATMLSAGRCYGWELLLDLKGCDLADLSEAKLTDYFVRLCDLIEMRRHGDPLFWEDHSTIPHLHGISAIQFIETSNVVCHALPILGAVYLNIFSCKAFDADQAQQFSVDFWRAKSCVHTVVTRT